MTLVSRSIPGLFGGVSQKIPALRHPTQCSVQDNAISTLVDGLYKRPGTRHVATLPNVGTGGLSVAGSQGNVTGHFIDRGTAGRHVLILTDGSLMLYDLLTGTPQVVNTPDGVAYLQGAAAATDFRVLTVADTTFVVNTAIQPAMLAATTPANPVSDAYVNVRQVASRNGYYLTVDGAQVNYWTSDTPKNSDVADGLAAAFNGVNGYTAYRVPDTNCVRIIRPGGGAIESVKVFDTYNNAGLQVLSNGAERFTDLPPRFDSIYTVGIVGTEGASSKYYVRWDGNSWVETSAPGVSYKMDPATMPHKLVPNEDGTWTFARITEWGERLVGDDKTAPLPTFISSPINSVFFHRNRLGFLAADAVVLSRAGDYFNFFPTSAQQVIDSDPIDLSAGADNVSRLTWATGFNQTLLLWSETDRQFVLTAGDILSPKTARVMPTTAFAFKEAVRPVSIWNKALFAAPFGRHTQMNLYKVADDRLTNTADDMTDDCPEYLPASISQFSASNTVRALVASSHSWTKDLYVWKWEQDRDTQKLTQRAWQRFTLERQEPVRVVTTHWADRKLYLLVCTVRAGASLGHHFAVEAIDFGKPTDDFGANVPLLLDRAVKLGPTGVAGGNTYLDLPYPIAGALHILKLRDGGLEPEDMEPLSVAALSSTKTRVTLNGEHTGEFVVGEPYTFTYRFTEPVMQDREGVPFMASELKHVRTLIRYEDAGFFQAEVSIPFRATYTYPFYGRVLGQPNQGASQVALSTGTFSIPVQAKAAGVVVELKSDSYLPCRFPYGEWVGDATMKAKR